MSKTKIAAAGVFCLLAIAGCSGSGTTGGGKGHSDSPADWFHNGYHFAQESVTKPSNNAAVAAKTGNQVSWCNDAYAPLLDTHAPANKRYEGVVTNAPPRGTAKASQQAYSQWMSGCVAGLNAKT
jgi:hypothetical protein